MTSQTTNRRWWTLAGCCAGLFLLMLDSTIVTLALPSIQTDVGASSADLQWILSSYLLAIGALVVTGGRLGDLRGRRTVFVYGMALFGAGAVLSAIAQSPEALIAGRVVQGVGAAGVLSLSLAIASAEFPPEERPRALGIWAGVSAAALALGPLLGGVLVETISWRWVFWSAIPFVVLGIAFIRYSAPEHEPRSSARLDVRGVITLTLGLLLLILALVQGREWGWASAATVGCGLGGVLSLVAFVGIERRADEPIVDFALFRNGPYFGASAAAFALVGCWWGLIFYQPQYLQNTLHYSPTEAGLLILPVTLPMVVISPLAGRLIDRFGARALMTVGMCAGVAGLILLTRTTATTGYGTLLPGYVLFGIALGLVYAPMSTAAMTAMPDAKAGIAAGVLAMNRIVAGALALGAVGAVYGHLEAERVGDAAYALAGSTWVLAGLCAVGAVLTWTFVRSAPRQPAAAGQEPERHHRWHFHL